MVQNQILDAISGRDVELKSEPGSRGRTPALPATTAIKDPPHGRYSSMSLAEMDEARMHSAISTESAARVAHEGHNSESDLFRFLGIRFAHGCVGILHRAGRFLDWGRHRLGGLAEMKKTDRGHFGFGDGRHAIQMREKALAAAEKSWRSEMTDAG